MKEIEGFLIKFANGYYGPTSITLKDVDNFMDRSTKDDREEIVSFKKIMEKEGPTEYGAEDLDDFILFVISEKDNF